MRKAGDGIRTRDSKLGKLALYQLSYTRISMLILYISISKERAIFVNKKLKKTSFFVTDAHIEILVPRSAWNSAFPTLRVHPFISADF